MSEAASAVATPLPNPDTPVEIGRPVALVKTMVEGVPRFGVVSVTLLVADKAPVPFNAVPRAAGMFAPRPDTPVEIGRPVALVSVPLVGVPRAPE